MKYAFIVEPGKHAKLSASSSSRWMVCHGSVNLSEGIPETSSEYAAEGTAAHWIAAECQKDGGTPDRWLGKTALIEGFEVEITENLCEAVNDFLGYIRENEQQGDVNFVEQSFTTAMRKLHPDFGGSADRVMWRSSEKLLRVYDYKHGAGVAVEVENNSQLKYYALGALLANPKYNAETVEVVIAQPRIEHPEGRIRTWSFPAIELIDFAADLVEAAEKTESLEAELVPGKKQCQWCAAIKANNCPALEEQHHALVAKDFDKLPVESWSSEKLATFLELAPLAEQRIKAVREFAYQMACRGVAIPGFKLVEKRAVRKWTDEKMVCSILISKPEYYTEPKLKSPAQIEKILGKKDFDKLLSDVVEKKSSGHTLAPADDPRPPATVSQIEDFEEVENDE